MTGAQGMARPADLRLRLVATVLAIACFSLLTTPWVAGCVLAAVLLVAWRMRPQARLWHRLLHVEGFLPLLFLTLPFTLPGAPLFTLGPLAASVEGSWRALLIACKVSASALLLMVMLGDVEPVRLGAALRGLKVNERLTRLFVMTVRHVGLIGEEARRLQDAMRARGFVPGSNRHTWRSTGNFIGMLLVRALARAQRIEEAMACRGYDGHFPLLPQPAPSVNDWRGFALLVGCAVAALGIDRL